MSNSEKSLRATIRSAVSAHKLPSLSKESVKIGATRLKKKRKTKWTSAPSRKLQEMTPDDLAAAHLSLKNYLTARRLKLARLTHMDAVLEGEQINSFLDYLRLLERQK